MRAIGIVVALGGCSLIVDPPEPQHPEVLVNSIGNLDQSNPVAVFVGDRFLVAWQDSSLTAPDLSEEAIRARFLDATGVPLAAEFLVNDPATARLAQEDPRIAAAGPSVLVVWTDQSGLGGDADTGVRARVLSSGGGFVSGELLVNTTTTGTQEEANVAASADGFVVVWTDASGAEPDVEGQAVRARRIRADGTPGSADDVVVNATAAGNQFAPSIASGADGRFLVAWTDSPPIGPSDIRARLLATDGTPLGDDVIVNATVAGTQSEPAVTALAGGGYLVVWSDESLGSDDPEGRAIRARRVDSDGAPVGSELLVNTTTRGDQAHAYAATLSDGSLFVVFEDGSQGPPDTDGAAVRARRLAADATPIGSDFLVNTFYAGDQEDPTLAVDDAAGVLVVWEDGSVPDGSGDGVHGRLYAAPSSPGP